MNKTHDYSLHLRWTGNKGEGTSHYRSYDREYIISIEHKADLKGSSDPSFRGNTSLHNPEELFVASLSACHMLWYLHLCSDAGIIVESYHDNAAGTMIEDAEKGGYFKEVILRPSVTIRNISMKQKASELHDKANKLCFIANSCNFPIKHESKIYPSSFQK